MSTQRPIGRQGTLARGTPSDHSITKQSLIDRGIGFSKTACQEFTFDNAWVSVSPFVPGANKQNCQDALMKCLKKKHKDEADFDVALFEALAVGLAGSTTRAGISRRRTTAGHCREMLIFNRLRWEETEPYSDWKYEYAVAVTTQVTKGGDLGIPKSMGCAKSSRQDHSCVIASRKNVKRNGTGEYYGWNIVECLSTTELKRRTTSVKVKKSSRGSADFIASPIGEPEFGALWQTIAYVISDVWTCIARRDATKKDGTTPGEIPFAILACDESGVTKSTDRFVFGHVLIPAVCGDPFAFNLVASKRFSETDSVERAAAAYINVIANGLALGESIKTGRECNVHSLIGLELQMFGRPQPGFNLKYSPHARLGQFVTTQGEIWGGTIADVSEIASVVRETSFPFQRLQFVDSFDSFTGETPLLIKAVSKMIHNTLVSQEANWVALNLIVSRNIEECVNKVLLAAERSLTRGTTLLMHDLQGYSDLQPENHSDMRLLWSQFSALVRKTLLGLAREGIVHPDIRPGYDFTSNILKSESEMLLIDLDSLVSILQVPNTGHSERYIDHSGLNQFGYVWWQCFVVAMAWKLKRPQSEGCQQKQNDHWTFFNRVNDANVTENDVIQMLNSISGSTWFDDQTKEDDIRAILSAFHN